MEIFERELRKYVLNNEIEGRTTSYLGRVIFCSGFPFPDVNYEGKVYHPGQGNNAYIFPGLALGVIVAGIQHIIEDYFIIAVQTVADEDDLAKLAKGSLYPPLGYINECSLQIASRILKDAYKNGKMLNCDLYFHAYN